MKKRIIIILFAALLLFACQPTPEEPIVLQKDQDLMIQQGSATLSPEQSYTPPEVPERYTYEHRDGALTILADAEVVMTSVPMPIVKVRAQGIPQETMYRLFAFLSNGEKMLLPHRRTKSEIEQAIKEYSEMLNETPPEGSDLTQEEFEYGLKMELELLQEEYKTAPDADEERISDGTYETQRTEWEPSEYAYLSAYSNNRELVVKSSTNADSQSSLRYYRRLKGFDSYDEMHTIPLDETVILPDGLDVTTASAQVQGFLNTIGETFEIAAVYRVDDAQDGSTDGIIRDAQHYALRFDCRRLVNGVPLAVGASDSGYSNESYSIMWRQEKLTLIVDAGGIVNVNWIDPLTVTDTVSAATSLLPFDKIQGIVEKMMPIVYYMQESETETTQQIDVRSVRLELVRVREQNNTKELKGMLIPAWVFYGSVQIAEHYTSGTEYIYYTSYGMRTASPYYDGEEIVFCINAIDGSIIDPMLGY